ncbi:MAG TPA: DUF4340 domain-containing protein [Steroidobacteraceae bacterium]|nr:DUF4340 domain-containing protein [Steroidobacteraceae bacterium]
MNRQRFTALLVAALLAISGALYLSTQRNLPRDPHGMALLPSLAGELNSLSALTVRKGAAAPVTVHKQGEQWTVAERADYPADVPKLKKLLLALSDAKIREEKTSNPDSYAVIGVEDPSTPGAGGTQIELTAQNGKHAVIVGKSAGEGTFIRRAGEKTSYIVDPAISVEAEPRYWIDARLLDIPTDKIQSVESKPASGAAYSVHRVPASQPKPTDNKPGNAGTAASAANPSTANPSTANPPPAEPSPAPAADKFVLDGVPNGRQAADSQTLAPSPAHFSNLTVEDVVPAGDIDFSKSSTVTVTLADGSVITFTGAVIGDKRWIKVAAPKDATLSAKANGRAFEMASYRYDGIFRPLELLLVPKPPPPPPSAKKPAAAPKP